MSENPEEKVNRLKALHEAKDAVKDKMLTGVMTAFGVAAALAWNDAIQSLLKVILPEGGGIIGKFVYALTIAATVAIISLRLGKITEKK